MRPGTDIVPTPPGESTLQALAFGDKEFYFRMNAQYLQNFGDTYGQFTSLRYYDQSDIYQWMTLLDTLNNRSDMLPSMAAYYFSQSQVKENVSYMVSYIYTHAMRDVPKKWWWLMQSIYLAQHKINDMDLALKVSKPLVNPEVPVFAQQMAAVVREKRGEMEDALTIMESIRDNAESISDQDLKYMRYFIEERLQALEKKPAAEAAPTQEEK
jgi:hypothetical protein